MHCVRPAPRQMDLCFQNEKNPIQSKNGLTFKKMHFTFTDYKNSVLYRVLVYYKKSFHRAQCLQIIDMESLKAANVKITVLTNHFYYVKFSLGPKRGDCRMHTYYTYMWELVEFEEEGMLKKQSKSKVKFLKL